MWQCATLFGAIRPKVTFCESPDLQHELVSHFNWHTKKDRLKTIEVLWVRLLRDFYLKLYQRFTLDDLFMICLQASTSLRRSDFNSWHFRSVVADRKTRNRKSSRKIPDQRIVEHWSKIHFTSKNFFL